MGERASVGQKHPEGKLDVRAPSLSPAGPTRPPPAASLPQSTVPTPTPHTSVSPACGPRGPAAPFWCIASARVDHGPAVFGGRGAKRGSCLKDTTRLDAHRRDAVVPPRALPAALAAGSARYGPRCPSTRTNGAAAQRRFARCRRESRPLEAQTSGRVTRLT
jgi:hypothetical protein